MIQRLYVHNFGCLENFELPLRGEVSALLIGKNGTGKSTVASVLEIFQQIGRGGSRVGELVKPDDFTRGNTSVPMRFEIEVCIDDKVYRYILGLELSVAFKEVRIADEQLFVDNQEIYSRTQAQVSLRQGAQNREIQFFVDWHVIALPIIHQQRAGEPLYLFQSWLANMLILAPVPSGMEGSSNGSTRHPKRNVSNFGEWFTGLLSSYPAAYTSIADYLPEVMPDFFQIENEMVAKDSRNVVLHFNGKISIDFNKLSDGEKCFVLCALVLAANKSSPVFCFWDEPDNFLTLSETGQFMTKLRRTFQRGGQLLVTSHNQQIIERFSDENTFLLYRRSHLEPTQIKLLQDIPRTGGLITTLIHDGMEIL